MAASSRARVKRFLPAAGRTATNLSDAFELPSPASEVSLVDADIKTLKRLGIPIKPKGSPSSDAVRIWRNALSRRPEVIAPKLSKRPEIRTYEGIKTGRAAASLSNVWSGGVVMNQTAMQLVFGQWVVPTVLPPASAGNADGDWWTVAWVGIDGWGSSDVLQCGTGHHVSRRNGKISTEYFAWYEWFPDNWIQISNFTVQPGDTVSGLITYDGVDQNGVQWGTATLNNISRGKLTRVQFRSPTSSAFTGFSGNCAEWVMERPQFSGVPAQVPEFGEIVFTNCLACSSTATFQASAGTPVNMVDNTSGKTLSTGLLEGDWKCTFVG